MNLYPSCLYFGLVFSTSPNPSFRHLQIRHSKIDLGDYITRLGVLFQPSKYHAMQLSRTLSSTFSSPSYAKNRTPPSSPTTAPTPLKFRRTDAPQDYISSAHIAANDPDARSAAFDMFNINDDLCRLSINIPPTQGASSDKGPALQDGRIAPPTPPSSKLRTQIVNHMPPPPPQKPQKSRVLPPAGRADGPAVALQAKIDMSDDPSSPYVPTKADLRCPPRPTAVVTRSLSRVLGTTPPTSPPHVLSPRTVYDIYSPEFLIAQREQAAQRRRDGTATPGAPPSPTSPASPLASPPTTPQDSPTAMGATPLGSPLQPWNLPSLPTINGTPRRYSPAPSPTTSPTGTAAAPLQRAVSITSPPTKEVKFVELYADSDMDCDTDEDMDEPLQRTDTHVSCGGQRALVDTPQDAPHTTCDVCLAHSSPMCTCDYCDRLRSSDANICNVCGRIHYVPPCDAKLAD